jgi:hypothetical protein
VTCSSCLNALAFEPVTGVFAGLLQVFKISLGGVAFDAFNVAEIKKVEDKS